jgi:hypothetical protein
MADTIRNHHGIRHLNLPERVAYQFVFEGLEGEDRYPDAYVALPGDDISTHPGHVMAGNRFLNRSPLAVRRILLAGKLDPYPKLKTEATAYLKMYETLTGENALGNSSNR